MKKQISYKIEAKDIHLVADRLNNQYGIPEIRQELAIYIKHSQSLEMSIIISKNSVHLRTITPGKPNTSPAYISSARNVKQLIKIITALGVNKGRIGEATCLNYNSKAGYVAELMVNTFIGDYLRITYEDDFKLDQIKRQFSDLEELSQDKKYELIKLIDAPEEVIIDELHILNSKITSYCERAGIISSAADRSIRSLLKAKSNNYANYEEISSQLLNIDLLSRQPHRNYSYSPVSIIAPFYNTNENIEKFLTAIESQNLTKKELAATEVILIDDGSSLPLQNELSRIHRQFTFKLLTVRINKNAGRAVARNLGATLASNRILIFTDSDILLSADYVREHSLRNQLVPNAIFVSFKQNISPNHPDVSLDNIAKGLKCSAYQLDSRIQKHLEASAPGLYEISDSATVDIFSDTNYFKDFGFGRNVGVYDLPAMVAGHNISCRRSSYKLVGGFNELFTGWGMEDSYFGSQMITKGNFVIPVLSCGVYHLDHPARSGSESAKQAQFAANLKLYAQLISESN